MSGFDLTEKGKVPATALLNCAHCNNTVRLVTHAQAVNVGCLHCDSLLARQGNRWSRVKDQKSQVRVPTIPLGTKSLFKEIRYAVTGFIVYQETTAPYQWREYVLFSPIHGYAFLSEYDGHWTYFRFVADISLTRNNTHSLTYQEKDYKLFHKYSSQVVYAAGEFPWRLLDNRSHYTEFVAPPYMLTLEKSQDEICWMQGEYVTPEEIQEAFGVAEYMPERIGVGAAEPFATAFSYKKVMAAGGAAVGVLFLLQILFLIFIRPQVLTDQSFSVPIAPEQYGEVTLTALPGPTFTLSSLTGSSNLELELYAPVDDEWFELGVTLINIKTNKAYDFEVGTEYYSGYEGGEYWTEGSQKNSVTLSAMQDGEYTLIVQPYRGALSKVDQFRLWVRRDVPLWSNLWILLLFIAAAPAVQWFRNQSFEKSRWMNSNYSPYDS
ncbi:DUF4178 domain-containing protein [Pontibacter populi]|uniref:DUF4178 domain-containing protein n=1 Tax=Pontibacter populi TaxID=890055 RepID=A0ABV1RXZ3_9BACT